VDVTLPAAGMEINRDRATGLYVITYGGADTRSADFKQVIVDPGAGTVRFGKPLPDKTRVKASYTPRALRLSASSAIDRSAVSPTDEPDVNGTKTAQRWIGNADSDTSAFVLMDKTPDTAGTMVGAVGTIGPSTVTDPGPVDRFWLFWRKPASGVRATTVFYKTMRLGIQLSKPISQYDNHQVLDSGSSSGGSPIVTVTGAKGPYEIDWAHGRIYFTEADERYPGLPGSLGAITVKYPITDPSCGCPGSTTETFDTISWQPELDETALLGNAADAMVNEGQVCAFAEPEILPNPTGLPLGLVSDKIWVFWASTRTGQTDLFYETLAPVFRQ
jgi:hypothetical protein